LQAEEVVEQLERGGGGDEIEIEWGHKVMSFLDDAKGHKAEAERALQEAQISLEAAQGVLREAQSEHVQAHLTLKAAQGKHEAVQQRLKHCEGAYRVSKAEYEGVDKGIDRMAEECAEAAREAGEATNKVLVLSLTSPDTILRSEF
jgi:chromosome segregation ATPase